MQMILVRHGHPEVPAEGHTGNPPLSARGMEHARHAGAALQNERIDRIFSSGMKRADATAKPLADTLGLPIEVHADLGEVDRCGGKYGSFDSIRQKGAEEWQRFMAAPLAYYGVDPEQFRKETLAAFRNVMDVSGDSIIAIFTHGFPINILLAHVLGLQHDALFRPTFGSITRVAGPSFDALTVMSVNESGHIPKALK